IDRLARTEPSPAVLAAPAERDGTVLYVEDNLSNLRLVERTLALRPGVKLIPAMQGRLGLALAQQHRPDLILLDLHLPDISGDQVLRELQGDPGLRQTPVVVLSADATPGQVQRLLAAGVRAYLSKPLDVRQLLALRVRNARSMVADGELRLALGAAHAHFDGRCAVARRVLQEVPDHPA